jgi:hypothetical protein
MLSALSFVHLIVTQLEYLGNIISITVDTSFFLSSIPFIVYLLRVQKFTEFRLNGFKNQDDEDGARI